ncbi:18K peptidoglycan-associated outer membrane lipoprotein [Methylophaga frappieri]|uniref:Peptidoglycan-associated lipoprotein n=1 Tax=Methylophaga frappieri (strain ATCC BAA-2434 / DSM 25690 / JAM7) TaxID=754477 RepID=I1YIX5_METFJ|nr:peptidoglycan-associated lipoprotein Pal [Methylophaga frappieri]AFJ02868.1 18K peptidoglycan-associated outer membrane lipoprotein [Methylophaga frappieri]
MQSLKLSALLMAALWLAACSGNTTKDGELAGDDVLVEDLGANSSGVDGRNANGEDMGAEARVVVGEGNFSGDELNDPDSPLSNRVVYFEYDSSTVRAQDQATLEAHAEYLGKNPNITVRLEGHTDDRGSREYNLALGERRALSIRQILMLQGASADQFRVTSFGEERPAAEGSNETAWAENRRVEIVYTGR